MFLLQWAEKNLDWIRNCILGTYAQLNLRPVSPLQKGDSFIFHIPGALVLTSQVQSHCLL